MFETRFIQQLNYGVCVGVSLPDLSEGSLQQGSTLLFAEEQEVVDSLQPHQQLTFIGGRLAMHRAFEALNEPRSAIIRDDRQAPQMPPGWVGSISHKEDLAIALLAHDTGWRLGVDIEPLKPERPRIARLTLTEREQEQMSDPIRWEELLVRFSAKEAIYKSIDPFVKRYVTFKEVETIPNRQTGQVEISLMLAHGERLEVEACWRHWSDYVITESRARPPQPA